MLNKTQRHEEFIWYKKQMVLNRFIGTRPDSNTCAIEFFPFSFPFTHAVLSVLFYRVFTICDAPTPTGCTTTYIVTEPRSRGECTLHKGWKLVERKYGATYIISMWPANRCSPLSYAQCSIIHVAFPPHKHHVIYSVYETGLTIGSVAITQDHTVAFTFGFCRIIVNICNRIINFTMLLCRIVRGWLVSSRWCCKFTYVTYTRAFYNTEDPYQ